jgi:beta-mannanase
LSRITRGDHDAYIKQWAADAKAWGYPLFLRFNWEMNGTWYPWSESRNTNAPGQFVTAWRHVHDIFKQTGVTNVTWVWCPNTEYPASLPLERLYPGDDYVNWVCADVYNSGTHPSKPDSWKSFDQVFNPTYAHLIKIAPSKPMMIAELGSTEVGGAKSAWVDDALTTQLSTTYSRIKAVLWFNWNADDMDWTIESSPAAQAAFARGIASRVYSSNDFQDLMGSPIAPLPAPETDRARR